MNVTKLKQNLLDFDKSVTQTNETLISAKRKFAELSAEMAQHGYMSMSELLNKSNDPELVQIVEQIKSNIIALENSLDNLYEC